MESILKTIKRILRENYFLELLSYIIQNNFLRKINFIGSGNWEPTFRNVYERFISIANGYLFFLKNENIEISRNTLIIELGVGYSTSACLEISKNTSCYRVIAYDAFMALNLPIDKYIKSTYYSDINNVDYILGINNLRKFLIVNKNNYDKILVFSNTVLQHVWNLKELLKTIAEFSTINSVHFHTIDLRNLNKFNKYGSMYFLKFSDFTWSLMSKNIGNQNRLRYDNYIDIFNELGYMIDLIDFKEFDDAEIQLAKSTYLKNKIISTNTTLNYSSISIKCTKVIK